MAYPPIATGGGSGGTSPTNITSITYSGSAADDPVTEYVADGVTYTVAYNGDGLIETITGSDGSVRTLTYNGNDQLTSDVTVPG